ncbi:hypothetical protein QR680_000355 [Steinernema hermaphroditum]|uniref:MATH domain-containing protein n=1 Tax=Steinernema hermaphroditum TaxID=289476 RepID=A0AA39GV22_9BILA|nr:hypothetical protein QR680_000355 [Steinernema hermaphroditum]
MYEDARLRSHISSPVVMITVKQTRTIRFTDGGPIQTTTILRQVVDESAAPKPVRGNGCKFASLGCDVVQVTKDHEKKRPIKHLTVTNDCCRSLLREYLTLNSQFNDQINKFNYLKASTNRMAIRGGPNYIWRINNWSKCFKNARENKTTLIYSDPFYSSTHEYRMQAVLAPFGQGRTFGHYASIYVQLLEGDFDAMLKWPYRAPVTFTFWDQDEDFSQRKNLTVRVTPNTVPMNAPFLMRPTNGANPPFGCDKFVLIDYLSSSTYVIGDALFIEIAIDMETEMLS